MPSTENPKDLFTQILSRVEGRENLPEDLVRRLVPLHHTSLQVHAKVVAALLNLFGTWSMTAEEMVSNTRHHEMGERLFRKQPITRTYNRDHIVNGHELSRALAPNTSCLFEIDAEYGLKLQLLLGVEGGLASTSRIHNRRVRKDDQSSGASHWVLSPEELPLSLKKWCLPSRMADSLKGSPIWVTTEEFDAFKKLIGA